MYVNLCSSTCSREDFFESEEKPFPGKLPGKQKLNLKKSLPGKTESFEKQILKFN